MSRGRSCLPLLKVLALTCLVAGGQALADTGGRPPPEPQSGLSAKIEARGSHHMVVTADPLASQAALDVLRRGGNALDAAIAAQMVLNVVEPQSSGIGGGGFLLYWDAARRVLHAYDGRETAPAAAASDRFLDRQGRPIPFYEAVVGGRSVGVPGLVRMLGQAHRRHGRLAWVSLFQPAIELAEGGFPVTNRLHHLLARDEHLRRLEPSRSFFYGADGAPPQPGSKMVNRPLASVMRTLATEGADSFYDGELAKSAVKAVRAASIAPGDLSLADMRNYEALERPPVCGPYRVYLVCGVGPPSSGGIAVLQMLAYLAPFDLAALPPVSAELAHLLAEAGKLAFADRARYVADPDFVPVPAEGLLDPGYLQARRQQIDPRRSMGQAAAGDPPWRQGRWGDSSAEEPPSTTHLSIVDAGGNAVALTSSIESAFGSRLMVDGYLLNNQLTDFSFRPTDEDRPVANRVEPRKRPRSSMAPTMVFNPNGGLVAVLGSAGGPAIIGHVVQTLVALLDHQLGAQDAVSLPHVVNRNGVTELEAATPAAQLAQALALMGHETTVHPMTSGLHVVVLRGGVLFGAADPRREGAALGE